MVRLWMLVLLVAGMLLVGCTGSFIIDSGNVVSQEKGISDFDKLDVSYGFKVNVQQGNRFSVVIRTDENLLERLQVVKQGSTLRIGVKPGRSIRVQNTTFEADITMPELTRLDISGGSHVTLIDFSIANSMTADLSGGCHLGGDIEAGNVRFDISGGSHVTLGGSAGNLTVSASGGSHAELADLAVVDANVDASGGSHVTVNPSGSLEADAGGGSHVTYLGSPTLEAIDVDDSSSIEHE